MYIYTYTYYINKYICNVYMKESNSVCILPLYE